MKKNEILIKATVIIGDKWVNDIIFIRQPGSILATVADLPRNESILALACINGLDLIGQRVPLKDLHDIEEFELIEDNHSPSDIQVGGDHYPKDGIQVVDFLVSNKIPFIEGSVIKYAVRHEKKNGKEDLLKAKHYIDLLIERKYPDQK